MIQLSEQGWLACFGVQGFRHEGIGDSILAKGDQG